MGLLKQIWLYENDGGILLIYQSTTMWINGAWIKRYCVLFSKTYNTLHSCHNFPAGSRQAARTWWRHQMETFSALLARCAGNSPVPGEFPTQRPVTRSFDVFFDLRLNKRLSKQPWGWWFETPSWSLWRHCNGRPYPWNESIEYSTLNSVSVANVICVLFW